MKKFTVVFAVPGWTTLVRVKRAGVAEAVLAACHPECHGFRGTFTAEQVVAVLNGWPQSERWPLVGTTILAP